MVIGCKTWDLSHMDHNGTVQSHLQNWLHQQTHVVVVVPFTLYLYIIVFICLYIFVTGSLVL
jgi:hypothetical protein